MKTKIGAAIISLLFLMACGSDKPKTDDQATETTSSPGTKFALKAANMMYISVQPDSSLKANEPDPTKAEVFEKVDKGNGRFALKTANGKFISDDRAKGSRLEGFADKASDWEQFEIIAIDQEKINIKTSAGKYVTANLANGGTLSANSDKASDWEVFIMESK